MRNPFINADKSVERASRVIPALFLLLIVLIDTALYVGWKSGEIQARIVEPVQAMRAHSLSQQAREEEVEFVTKRKKAIDAASLLKEFKEAQESKTTSVTTTTNNGKTTTTVRTYTNQPEPATPPSNKGTSNYEFSQFDTSYEPPAWFKERSAQSQAEFEAKSAQSKAEFEAFSAKSKADFEASKAESQAKIDAWKAENGF